MTSDPHRPDARLENGPDLLAELLRAAGRREEPPTDAYRCTLEAATAAWQRKVRRRRTTRMAAWALAACVLAGIGTAVLMDGSRGGAIAVAQVERTTGAVEMLGRGRDAWAPLDATQAAVVRGSMLRTAADSGAGIVLAGGVSLRLDSDTRIELASATRIRLFRGRVYLDTGAAEEPTQGVEIATPAGVARDVGTQFEVQYLDDAYRLRVREGLVQIRRAGDDIESAAGEEIAIDASGVVRRARVARNDPDWRWAEALAPAPELDGQPVSALLAWVERETGRSVRFESPEIERRAGNTILHGSVGDLAPLEALDVMLATTDLAYAILENGTILVGARDT